MKIRPVPRQSEPKYPTQGETEWNPALLAHVPARWEKSPGLAAMLGLLALSGNSCTEAAEDPSWIEQAPVEPEAASSKQEAVRHVRKATAVVAPILEEALAYDGRGTFGCEASEPAQFLAEDDALELIREELEAAGLNLTFAVDLEPVMSPTGEYGQEGWKDPINSGDDTEEYMALPDLHVLRGPPAKTAPGKYTFDWADREQSIYIEYLSTRDYRNWEAGYGATAWSLNFADVAERVAEAFGKSPLKKPAIFGVFFEPLANKHAERSEISGLTPEQKNIVALEYRKRMYTEGEKRGREKLRRQVRHFVEFLRKEGVVPNPG